MRKEYIAIEQEDSRYYKNVPYIKKKEYEKDENNVVVGVTRLKKYKSKSEEKELDLLHYEDEGYEVKEKIFGFKKGYIFVGNNNFIILKRRIPFLILLLFMLLLIFLLFIFNFDKEKPKETIITPVQNEIVVPEEKEEIIIQEEAEVHQNIATPVVKKKYRINFDGNGGDGRVESIICEVNSDCNLPENKYKRKGYTFVGWSTSKEINDLYTVKVKNLSLNDGDVITLYASWQINSYKISFLDFDESIIQENLIKYGEEITSPLNPLRNGYTFMGWDKEFDKVEEDTVIKALYELNSYKISYELNDGVLDKAPTNYDIESEEINIPLPTKEGYTFVGWTNDEESTPIKDYKIEEGSIGDLELIANYEPNSYNLIFNSMDNDNSQIKRSIKYNETFSELPIIERTGYTFKSWYDINKDIISNNTIFKYTEDVNLYADWKIIDYSIAYELNDGVLKDGPSSYNVESKEVNIPVPTKEGYTFVGWTSDEESNPIKDYTIKTGSTGDLKLIANYEPILYYVNYDSSNGDGVMPKDEFLYNQKYKLSKNVFTKEGYTFVGWSTSKDGDVIYKDETEIINLSSESEDIITLYAKWEIIKLNVKYYDLFGALLKEETVNYGSKSKEPSDPYLSGYTFEGWTPKVDVIKTDTIYKALYSVNNYTIKYNLNIGNNDDVKEIDYNVETETFTLPNPERIGYTFLGWTGTNILKPQVDLKIQKGSTGNKSYKANWVSNMYEVKLNPNSGILNGSSSFKVSYNSLYGLLPTPTREGYTFDGWYYNGELINSSSIQNKEYNHELIAKWKVIYYDVVYNLNGGISEPLQTSYSIESDTFILPTPMRKGYTFLGWTGTNGDAPELSVSVLQGSTGNRNYNANWSKVDYSISYELNGGTSLGLKYNYDIESETFTLPTPIREGYTFLGWTGANGNTPELSVSVLQGSTGDRNYIANWNTISYSITYDLDSGKLDSTVNNYNIESETFTLPTPTKDGYTFLGWTGTNGDAPELSVSVLQGSTGDKNYIANWKIVDYSISYELNGGTASGLKYSYNVESETFTLPNPEKRGYTFLGWTGTNGNNPTKNIQIKKGSSGNRNYIANYSLNIYTITYNTSMSSLPSNPITYTVESETFTLSNPEKYGEFSFVGWSGTEVEDKLINLTIPKGSIGDRAYTAEWYDDTAPTITGFIVEVLGENGRGGHNIYISVDGYDNGVGIDRYETWLVPYRIGSGAGREIGASRILTDVLYLTEPAGRTLCGYAIDKNGNEAEACYTVYG